jgi:mono/diheme cytochrome c family protein
MVEEIHAPIMKKIQYLTIICLLGGTAGLFGQTAAKGDAAKGKDIFDQQCGLCHDATTTDKKMGPGLKGLYKNPKLTTTGKPTNDANVLEKINIGGNGMPPEKDLLSDAEKADLLAYLKTL